MFKRKKYKILLFLIIIIDLLTLTFLSANLYETHQSQKLVKSYFTSTTKEVKDKYLGILEIPTINLKQGFYSLNDKRNNVNQNIQILNSPDGNIFAIAGHSGNGKRAYFKNIVKLNINDKINVYYQNDKYLYQIIKSYEVPKNKYIVISKTEEKELVLTTCSNNDDKQLIVIAKLKDILKDYTL